MSLISRRDLLKSLSILAVEGLTGYLVGSIYPATGYIPSPASRSEYELRIYD
ncbi:MAG: hypothetical protein QXS45_00385 [Sulfolobales archaeon]